MLQALLSAGGIAIHRQHRAYRRDDSGAHQFSAPDAPITARKRVRFSRPTAQTVSPHEALSIYSLCCKP
jgi:hypothetical protein